MRTIFPSNIEKDGKVIEGYEVFCVYTSISEFRENIETFDLVILFVSNGVHSRVTNLKCDSLK